MKYLWARRGRALERTNTAHGVMLMAMGDRFWRNLGSDGVGLCARIQVHVAQCLLFVVVA
jgi:hypothetical protein